MKRYVSLSLELMIYRFVFIQFEQDSNDYEREAREWLQWVERATRLMQDRNVPNSIPELRQLINELDKFKTEDLPPRLHDKQRLADLYSELQVS